MRKLAVITALGLLAAGATATPASAATIKAKLAKGRGYTVLALAQDGRAAIDRIGKDGRVRIRLPNRQARQATLHLIGRDSSYYGPVVLRRKGRRASLHLRGRSVDAGRIRRLSGFARVKPWLPKRLLSRRTTRLNRAGSPTGAGALGLVDLVGDGARPAQEPEVGGDGDGDGIPGPFDVDDDGDAILDTSDVDGQDGGPEGAGPDIASSLPLGLEESLNVSASGVTRAMIDARLVESLNLLFNLSNDVLPGLPDAVDVDCGTLSYCRPATGTAIIRDDFAQGAPDGERWVTYDPNGDGFPNLSQNGPSSQMNVLARADTGSIASGDTYTFLVRDGGTTTLPASLVQYFTTTPATRSYDAGSGPVEIRYPVAPGTPGTPGNPIQLTSDEMTFVFWRPQRPAVEGAEDGAFVDIGHLNYGVRVDIPGVCEPSEYSNVSPTLGVAPQSFLEKSPEVVLRDSADDAPPGANNFLSFTVDIGACARRTGADQAAGGGGLVVSLTAEDDARNIARQHLTVRLPD